MMDRPRVLVVDPDEGTETLVRKVLEKHCDLVFLTDPLWALDTLEAFEPDLVIMGLEMPSLTGFELLSLIKCEPAFQSIPIMILSRIHDLESQKLAYRMGAEHFQAKPCRPSQLFKGAAMFYRNADGGARAAKRLAMVEVERVLKAKKEERQVHPLIATAMAAHGRRMAGAEEAGRSVMASVAQKKRAE